MPRLLAKVLLFVAMLMAPLTMTAAPAAPMHGAMAAAMPMNHCPDEDGSREQTSGVADCTMACAAALPALQYSGQPAVALRRDRVGGKLAERLDSLDPEIATPPPKRA
jgi:hypothetical protein